MGRKTKQHAFSDGQLRVQRPSEWCTKAISNRHRILKPEEGGNSVLQGGEDVILPHRSLVLEESARTTRENFQRSGELLSGQGALGVITNRCHLARAGLLAQQEGLNAVLIPAEDTWEWSRANLHATLREAALYWPARWGW